MLQKRPGKNEGDGVQELMNNEMTRLLKGIRDGACEVIADEKD